MRLAIVGSCHAPEVRAREIICDVLERLRPSEVVSGGARGVDTWAADEARKRGIAVREFVPTVQTWHGNYGYKARNADIANYCEALVRIAWTGSTTYGSGWTRDQAKRLGKQTWEYVI